MTTEPKTIFRFARKWMLSIWGLAAVLSAALHRLQLVISDSQSYASSPLTGITVILVLTLILAILTTPVYAVRLLMQRRWRDLGILAINVAVGIVCVWAAVHVDAPSLIYRT